MITEAMLRCHKVHVGAEPPMTSCNYLHSSRVTGVHKRAHLKPGGRRQTDLSCEEPMAAALEQVSTYGSSGHMVVDVGGGTTDIAVISLGGIVVADSCSVGGDKFDESITRYVRRMHNLMIGERTAEDIKITIGSVYPQAHGKIAEIKGRDFVTGLHKTLKFSSEETCEALMEPANEIINSVKGVLERTPPELAADIVDRGIICTGGGALLNGFPSLISHEIGIPFYIAEYPMICVVLGASKMFESPKMFKDNLVADAKFL